MKLFDENDIIVESQAKNRTDFKYYLLDPMFNYIQELSFLESNAVINKKINTPSELSFTVPTVIDDINVFEFLKPFFIIEAVSSKEKLYFLILKNDINIDKNNNEISFNILEYQRQLAKDMVHDYEEDGKTIQEVTDEILLESSWKVVYIDSDYNNKVRSFSFKQKTVLESLQSIAEMFNALIEWNNREKKISFINPNRLRVDRGLVLSSDKYLEGVNLQINSEELTTRLYLFGKDNLSVERLTPTGSRYLEDYSWFMKPFEMNDKGQVLQSSEYMSDGLCISLVHYQELLKDNQGKFDEFLERRGRLEDELFTLWFETTELKIELTKITDRLDVLNSTNGSASEINATILEKEKQEKLISDNEEEIDLVESELDGIKVEIDALKQLLDKENNFTKEELLELDNFTITKVFQDTSIEESEDLLDDGIDAFKKMKQPQISASIDVNNFLNNKEYIMDWDKIELGTLITVEIDNLGFTIQAQVMEETIDQKENSYTIQIANENSKALGIDDDEFVKMIYGSHSASTVVNMDKYKWDLAEEANDNVSKILNNAWDATKNQIQGGVNQSVTISERGLIIRSSDNPNHLLVAQNGVLGLSRDNGNTWRTAITPDGVFAETLVGKLIVGNKLVIEDENGIIKINGDQQIIYDKQGNEKVILGKLDDKGNYGISIKQGAFYLEGGITSEDIDPELLESLQYDDTQLREDLRLEAPLPSNIKLDGSGITTTSTGDPNKFARLDYRGLYVQGGAVDVRTGTASNRGVIFDGNGIRGYNSSGTKTFEVDTNGNLTANTGTFGGRLNAAGGTFNGNLSAAGGTFTGTLSGVDGTFTGTLRGNDIIGSSITGGQINVDGVTGQFRVTTDGDVTIKGYDRNGSGDSTFKVDSNGIALNRTGRWVEEGELKLSLDGIYTSSSFAISTASLYVDVYGFGVNASGDIDLDTSRDVNISSGGFKVSSNTTAIFNTGLRAYDLSTQTNLTLPDSISFSSASGSLVIRANAPAPKDIYLQTSNEIKATKPFATGTYIPIRASSFPTGSSIKFKQNIEKLTNYDANRLLDNIDIMTYHLNSNVDSGIYDKPKLGLISEMIPSELRDEDGVDPYSLVSLALKLLQIQKEEINVLKETIEDIQKIL